MHTSSAVKALIYNQKIPKRRAGRRPRTGTALTCAAPVYLATAAQVSVGLTPFTVPHVGEAMPLSAVHDSTAAVALTVTVTLAGVAQTEQ